EFEDLRRRSRSRSGRAEDARRARLILMLADNEPYHVIKAALDCDGGYIVRWRARFLEQRLAGLYPRHRGSTAKRLTPRMEAKILEATRRKPDDGSTHWSTRRLAKKLGIDHMMVARCWARAGIKPHRIKRYMLSTDPEFETKAADVIALYVNPPQHAAVISLDEKTAIQALDRLDPVLPFSPGRLERHGFEYYRHGTLSLYAALNVKTGEVIGETCARHTTEEFVAFLGAVVASQPKHKEIHVILDNLSTHKTKRVAQFLAAHPHVHLHFTPTYSSWLNQIEIWFSKIERDLIARGIFTSVKDLARKIMTYIKKHNRDPKPIRWTYTDLSNRISSNSVVTRH
ncbi:MAG TPA: IS630 family transposase, partial [Thermoanaerobaculia bacterium]|nr:IS630 family transposase [Thermoanaerobaculia bacterium]